MIVPEGPNSGRSAALLRLRGSDEDSSLWRLRCREGLLRDEVKQLLGNR